MKRKEDVVSKIYRTCLVEDRILCWALVLLIVGTATVFNRSMFYTFYLPQLTLFWMVSFFIFLIGIQRKFLHGGKGKNSVSITVASTAFVASLVVVSIFSSQTWVSFTGLTARGAGAISYVLCVAIFYSVFKLGTRRSTDFIIWAFVITNAVVVLYALLQIFDLDPITWGAETQQVSIQVFSTLGNANFSSGYVGITIPLVIWAAFGSSISPTVKVMCGALLGGATIALVNFSSTQGDLAALFSLVILFHWIVRRPRSKRYQSAFIALPVSIIVGIIPLAISGESLRLPLLFPVITSFCAYLGTLIDEKHTFCVSERILTKRQWKIMVTFALAVGSLLGFLLRSRIIEELKSGLDQRFEFWKVAFSIFGDNPIFGTGLETYLSYFTSHRTKEHGVNWELVTSDSAHSVPIGFLSNGGIVLFLAYLSVIFVIGYFGVQAIKLAEGPRQHFFLAVFVAWIAYHLQSSVSIDTTGLMCTQWILGGILVAAGLPKAMSQKEIEKENSLRKNNQQVRETKFRILFSTISLFVVFVLVSLQIIAPYRANVLAFESEGLYLSGDIQKSEEKISRAIELDSRNPSYHQMLAVILENTGRKEAAFIEFEKNADLTPGDSRSASWVAYSAFALNDFDTAEDWFLKAVEYNPYSPNLMLEVAGFYTDMNQKERALTYLDLFESLETSQNSYWERAQQIYLYLGEKEKAESVEGLR